MSKVTENGEQSFEYTYSAKEQAEIENIRKKYLPREENKMEELRKLDKSVETPGTIWAIIIGVAGALVMGTGMSCCMVWADTLFVPGIFIGVLGMLLVAAAYPAFRRITKHQRKKLAPRILELTEELSR